MRTVINIKFDLILFDVSFGQIVIIIITYRK